MWSTSVLGLVTIATIDRAVISWLERYLSFIPTACADSGIHLTWFSFAEAAATTSKGTPLSSGLLASSAAIGATCGGVSQPLACVKFLLANGKREWLIAVAAIQSLVGIGHIFFSIPGKFPFLNALYRAACNRQSILSNKTRYSTLQVYHGCPAHPLLYSGFFWIVYVISISRLYLNGPCLSLKGSVIGPLLA